MFGGRRALAPGRAAARPRHAAAASAKRTFEAGVASSLDVLDANDKLYQADVAWPTRTAGWASRAWHWTGLWDGCADEPAMNEPDRGKLADGALAETATPSFDEIEREELSRLFGRVAWARVAVLPALVGVVMWLLATDETPWRRWSARHAHRVGVCLLPGRSRAHRGSSFRRGTIRINLTFAVLAQQVSPCTGVWQPISLAMFPIAMIVAITTRPPGVFLLMAARFAVLWAMALAESRGWCTT